ncbi:peptidoglycan-binding protein [Streptomyces sp. NBC_01180]|uniref:peptidoglycan-binding protein n=1 Tax=Streptomyces sp. NBC_01180 TaxID=2903763 RepID=UPI00386ED6C9|nr:peptidoglycan-binding protein [Streptomyces sp. NBC_01180]
MARMPGATWRPVPNCTRGGQNSVRGVVLHVMAGTLDGSDSWFRNPSAQASAHFGIGRDGRIFQWVDTADRAWAQSAGNRDWLSIEHEGQGGDSLTAKQLAASAAVIAWMHRTHGVPLQATDSVSGHGIGWHGMGGAAWGGHTSCPGTPIKNQRDELIEAAGGNPAPPVSGGSSGSGVARYQVTINSLPYGYGAHGDHVTAVGKALVKRGYGKHYAEGPGPEWTDADTENFSDFQESLGFEGTAPHQDADGVPGETSLRALLGTLPGKAAAKSSPPPFPGRAKFGPGQNNAHVTTLGRQLVKRGYGKHYTKGPGPKWSNADRDNVRDFQHAQGWTGSDADGYPGPATWRRLFA